MSKINLNSYNSRIFPTWCPGCGNFGVSGAIKNALSELNLTSDQVMIIYDIGCSGNMADFLKTYAIHALHGRAISVAVGAHLAYHKFPIIALGGDGGIYGEGVEHLLKACRANFNMTVIVCNNGLYSLTTGQSSPTSEKGKKTKTTPEGVIDIPLEPLKTAILHDAGFVARGFAGDIPYLAKLITLGIQHQGFALIDVLQPCITFDKDRNFAWYKKHVYQLKDFKGLEMSKAIAKLDEEQKIVTGVLYRSQRPAYDAGLPQLKDKSLLEQSIKEINIKDLIDNFR